MSEFNIINGKTDCSPEEVGYDSSRVLKLKAHFDRLIDEKKIFGATYCVARHGKTFLHGAIGRIANIEGDTRPVLPDTVIGIASETKTFTAVAIFKLMEDGLLRLDDPVGNYLPQFKEKPFDAVTIYQLLTHTSGIYPDENCFPDKYRAGPWQSIGLERDRTKSEDFDWISVGLRCGLKEEPGTHWMYCSFGFAILSAVIEAVSGIKAQTFIEENICIPLGMKDTRFDLTKDMAARSLARCKEHDDWLKKVASGVEDEGTIWEKVPNTGGGLYSTAQDLVIYGNMLLNKGTLNGVRILGRKAFEKMTTQALKNIPDFCWGAKTKERKYGIGFDMREGEAYTWSKGTFYHEGAGACSLIMDPVEDIVASYFVPFADDNWYSEALYNTHNIIWSGIK